MLRKIAAGAALLFAGVAAAAAQFAEGGGMTAKAIVIDVKPLIEQIVPYVIAAAGTIITAAGGMAVAYINKWAKSKGIEIDDSHRDALLQAVRNVAAGAIAAGAVKVEQNGKITVADSTLARIAKDVVEKRAPDAVEHFGLTPEQVAQKIVEQVPQIMAATPAKTS